MLQISLHIASRFQKFWYIGIVPLPHRGEFGSIIVAHQLNVPSWSGTMNFSQCHIEVGIQPSQELVQILALNFILGERWIRMSQMLKHASSGKSTSLMSAFIMVYGLARRAFCVGSTLNWTIGHSTLLGYSKLGPARSFWLPWAEGWQSIKAADPSSMSLIISWLVRTSRHLQRKHPRISHSLKNVRSSFDGRIRFGHKRQTETPKHDLMIC